MLESFRKYLINVSKSVKADSTINSYTRWVAKVRQREGLSWETFANNIDDIVVDYDIGGTNETYGSDGNRSVINALKQFARFSEYQAVDDPLHTAKYAIKKAAALTQEQIVELRSTASPGSLLITLRNFLIAVGAENPKLMVTINGTEITINL